MRCTLGLPQRRQPGSGRSRGNEPLNDHRDGGRLRLRPIRTLRRRRDRLPATQVARLARRLKVDIVHANSIRASLVVGVASHSLAVLSDTCAIACRPAPLQAILRLIGATCTHIVANSHYTRRHWDGRCPQIEIVIHTRSTSSFSARLLPASELRRAQPSASS